jgi:Flp pilus assembly protein TadG
MLAFLFLSMAALVVDGGMTLNRRERAADLAEQAARYAAQDIDVDALRGGTVGDTAPINYVDCDANVQDYLTKVGLDVEDRSHSGCTSKSAEQVTVVVQLTWKPLISGIVMRGAQHAKGTATAESVTG